jgi:hypothetical protein
MHISFKIFTIQLLSVDPSNEAATKEMAKLRRARANYRAKQKEMSKSMARHLFKGKDISDNSTNDNNKAPAAATTKDTNHDSNAGNITSGSNTGKQHAVEGAVNSAAPNKVPSVGTDNHGPSDTRGSMATTVRKGDHIKLPASSASSASSSADTSTSTTNANSASSSAISSAYTTYANSASTSVATSATTSAGNSATTSAGNSASTSASTSGKDTKSAAAAGAGGSAVNTATKKASGSNTGNSTYLMLTANIIVLFLSVAVALWVQSRYTSNK